MKNCLLLFLLLFTLWCNGQNLFKNTYGDTEGLNSGNSIVEASNKSFIIVGSASGYTQNAATDILIMRIDSTGNTLWTRIESGINVDIPKHIIKSNNNSFYIVGYTNSTDTTGYDVFVMNIDTLGNIIWKRNYGGIDWDFGYKLTIDNNNNLYIAGETYTNTNGNADGFITKLDSLGNIIWHKNIGSVNKDYFKSIVLKGDFVYAAGTTITAGLDTNAYFAKVSLNGQLVDTATIIYSGIDEINDITLFNNTQFIAGGYSNSFNPNKIIDLYQLKIDTNLNYVAHYIMSDGIINSLILKPNTTDIAFCGFTNSVTSSGYKLSFTWVSNNDFVFDFCSFDLAATEPEEFNQIIILSDGNIAAIGTSQFHGPGLSSIMVMKSKFNLVDNCNAVVSEVVSVKESIEASLALTLYPNPADDMVYITIPSNNSQPISYTVTNYLGQVALSNTSITNQFTIDNQLLNNGIYFLTVQIGNATAVKKLIINR